jgi:carbon-monoxide dehydrogenase medium subunit
LSRKEPKSEIFAAAGAAAAAAIDPIDDNNNPTEYRRALVQTLVERALAGAA